jgi:type IV pilus assembly protein PilO
MKLEDFNNIDFNNAGSLPNPVKAVLLTMIFLILVVLGYYFLWSPVLDSLTASKVKEQELRQVFIDKKVQSINLAAYKEQMIEIEKTFGALLKQLPNKSQMDGLLTDINQAGLGRGLEFDLFKPGAETKAEFYAEMPISIKILGAYHDLGAFATDISKLSRIVTLNDIQLSSSNKEAALSYGSGVLVMEAVAKTYRYLDTDEIQAKRKASNASNTKVK